MIEARHISKSFGSVRAVRDVSFRVAPGEVVGLLGANGAGKTTTLRILTGFLPPDAGNVVVAGHDVVEASRQARARVGYLPESAPAYPEMRARDYLDFRARLFGLDRRRRRRAVAEVIDLCDLRPVARRRIGHLSKGYRQRVGLAAALVHDPSVLVLDEPTNGLDPGQIRHARSLIRDLARRRTVIVSSHILPEIETTCDRVIIMAAGRVRADRSIASLHGQGVMAETRLSPGAEERVLAAIREIPGVQGASLEPVADGWVRLHVHAPERDVRQDVARALHEGGCPLRALGHRSLSLERLFLQIMEDAGHDGDGSHER